MKKRNVWLGILIIFLGFLAFMIYKMNAHPVTISTANRTKIETVIKKNYHAINQGDVELYLATIYPPKRDKTGKKIAKSITQKDFVVKLESFKIQRASKNEVLAQVSQQNTSTNKAKKKALVDCSITLKKYRGHWYIAKNVITNNTYLN